jgi:TolA-binding protein
MAIACGKFLPEAEAVLLDFIKQFPDHKRISYARNLLGRAYLDDNRVRSAEQVFLQNYLADKTADRAPDSLLYLAIALARDKEVKRACDAIGEFRQTYPTEAAGRLKGQFDALTKTVTCH